MFTGAFLLLLFVFLALSLPFALAVWAVWSAAAFLWPVGLLVWAVALLCWPVAVIWIFARLHLRGEDLSAYDDGVHPVFGADAPSPEHGAVVASLARMSEAIRRVPGWQRLAAMRTALDELFAGRDIAATFVPVDAGGVPAQWVLAPNADARRRLLYIHGGAFMMGSPKSHRTLTSRFSEAAGAAVLAIDYRLMPEHRRAAGIEDCRRAYRWMVGHGPDGPGEPAAVFVAGDSAGGNLALSLIAWVRDRGLRAPDAAVALSPLTDGTMASPSLRGNVRTDPMLGPVFGPLSRIPRMFLLVGAWLLARINPRDPVVSPVYGNLANLPPVLVQASEAEMLRDDARRYVNRAVASGSPVRLQTWRHMVHVWQIFQPDLPEAREAFDEIRKFLADPRGGA